MHVPRHAQHIKVREEEGMRAILPSQVAVTRLPAGVKPGQSTPRDCRAPLWMCYPSAADRDIIHTFPPQQLQTLGAAPRVEGPL